MSLPRFKAHKLLRGKDINLVLDAIDQALVLPSALEVTNNEGSALVSSITGVGSITAAPTTGVVGVSMINTTFDTSKVNLARAYTTISRSSSATAAVVTLEVIDRDVLSEFDVNGAWTAAATGFYIVTARLAFDADTSGTSSGYIYVNGSQWAAGRLNATNFSSASSPIFGMGFVAAGSVMKLYGFCTPLANIVGGTSQTFLEICRVG